MIFSLFTNHCFQVMPRRQTSRNSPREQACLAPKSFVTCSIIHVEFCRQNQGEFCSKLQKGAPDLRDFPCTPDAAPGIFGGPKGVSNKFRSRFRPGAAHSRERVKTHQKVWSTCKGALQNYVIHFLALLRVPTYPYAQM